MKKWLLIALMFLPSLALAEDKLDSGDTAWMMMSAALVLLMTPAGLALFYGGMTRSKNVLNTYAMVFMAFMVAFVAWIVAGYSVAFGIHFLAGLWGALATGFLAVNDHDLLWDGPLKATGDRMGQVMVQLESILVVGLFTLIGTIVVYYIASALTGGGRVDEETEEIGLDEVT